jgi:hypothetical protein
MAHPQSQNVELARMMRSPSSMRFWMVWPFMEKGYSKWLLRERGGIRAA